MNVHTGIERAIKDAATAANFNAFRIVRTDTNPRMYDNARHYVLVVKYSETQITALRRCVEAFTFALPDYRIVCGYVAVTDYYAVVIDTAPNAAEQSGAIVSAPRPIVTGANAPSTNGKVNGHSTNGKAHNVQFSDLPKAIKEFENWLESVGRKYLQHSDEIVVDYELVSGEHNEVKVFMRSDEHRITFEYLIQYDAAMNVIDFTSVHTNECAECRAEYDDAHPQPPRF